MQVIKRTCTTTEGFITLICQLMMISFFVIFMALGIVALVLSISVYDGDCVSPSPVTYMFSDLYMWAESSICLTQ